jgi:hypothetical protein
VSWRFTPGEKRLAFTLPPSLGGASHELALIGGYTFARAARAEPSDAMEPARSPARSA